MSHSIAGLPLGDVSHSKAQGGHYSRDPLYTCGASILLGLALSDSIQAAEALEFNASITHHVHASITLTLGDVSHFKVQGGH